MRSYGALLAVLQEYFGKHLRPYVDEAYRIASYVNAYSSDILPIPPIADLAEHTVQAMAAAPLFSLRTEKLRSLSLP
jgi:hypothetical protein